MNKQDIAIVALLVILLFGWFHYQNKVTKARMEAWRSEQAAIAATNETAGAAISVDAAASAGLSAAPGAAEPAPSGAEVAALAVAEADAGEEEEDLPAPAPVVLENGELSLEFSPKGAAIVSATLKGYRESIERDSPDLTFDYGESPALALGGLKGLGPKTVFEVAESSPTNVVFRRALENGAVFTRSATLCPDYRIEVADSVAAGDEALALPEATLSIGVLKRQSTGNTSLVSVDNLPVPQDGSPKVLHWERKRLLTKLFTGGRGGGCAGAPDASLFPPTATERIAGPQKWVALKTRFFAQVLEGESSGFSITAGRSLERGGLRIDSVSGALVLPGAGIAPGSGLTRSFNLYIGPKKYSVIRRFAEKSGDIMEFGMWGFLCVLLIPFLNFLNMIFRNYGVAIIVLTIIVRLVFWPLTRKSNESMKKMGAIQPQIKEIQAKFKNDPQKLQQETMKLYRDNHVNPMSSCLPMLIQIPVFIALFVVLRSATELRFAPFLWIRDLSEPENLLKGVIPFVPALNILPFVMAGTMFLQSKLTPSMGDPSQQKMMMWMMPLMMFFMFYSMPSALLLYWSVSQLLAIVQLLRQKKARAAEAAAGVDGTISGDALSRQERRRIARGR